MKENRKYTHSYPIYTYISAACVASKTIMWAGGGETKRKAKTTKRNTTKRKAARVPGRVVAPLPFGTPSTPERRGTTTIGNGRGVVRMGKFI